MFRKWLLAFAMAVATMGTAFAQVDVNTADQAALDGIKGIGPSMSKKILEARKKDGPYKDWADLQKRVPGVGDKRAAKLSQAGLTVNGQGKPQAAVKPVAAKEQKKEAVGK